MMASNSNFSLWNPNQQGWMQQGQAGVMPPYQAPAYQPSPIDWGVADYMSDLGQYGSSNALDFRDAGGGTPNTPTGSWFGMNWDNISKGFGLGNAALQTIGTTMGILNDRKKLKAWKQGNMRSFNAKAIQANNALRQRENAGVAFAGAHGVDYTPNAVPLKMIGGWGKSGKGVGVDDRQYGRTG